MSPFVSRPARRRPHRGVRGVTLIELLIAVTIGAMAVVSVFACFNLVTTAQQRGEAHVDSATRKRAALRTIVRDLRSAFYAQSEDEVFEFVGENAASGDAETDSVQFVTAVNDALREERPAYDLCQVTYLIDTDDTTPEEGLIRLRIALPIPDDEDTREQYTEVAQLLPTAISLDMLYYDDEEATWVEEWTDRPGLPAAVKGQVIFTDPTAEEDEAEPETEALSFVAFLPVSRYEEPQQAGAPSGAGGGVGEQPPGEGPGSAASPTTPGLPGGAGSPSGPGMPGIPNFGGGGFGR
ncbi:MAG: type II secretion system protein J [Armatimonadota bacterium]